MDLKTFASAISQITEEKGISEEKVFETIEAALAAAYKRDYASRGEQIRVKLDTKSGKMQVYKVMLVVDESMLKPEEEEGEEEVSGVRGTASGKRETPARNAHMQKTEQDLPPASESAEEDARVRFNPERHTMVKDARKIKKGIKAGEELLMELETHEEFGRIAAQTAKQVIIQRLREAEREAVVAEYQGKESELISGIVQRVEGRTVFVDLGKGIGMLFPQEQIPGEYHRIGSRVRALLLEVNMSSRGPQIILSRSHPEVLKKLFMLEVPEIAAGAVEVKAVAREAGSRSKVAVTSHQEGVDPIGACVGQRGTRVMTVINELGGEKIDIIEWSEDTGKYLANSLSPAKVLDVELKERSVATVMVPDDQLSLAIGKGGQNVRLAAKLTNWKIEIRGETTEASAAPEAVSEVTGEVTLKETEDGEGIIRLAKKEKAEAQAPISLEALKSSEQAQESALQKSKKKKAPARGKRTSKKEK